MILIGDLVRLKPGVVRVFDGIAGVADFMSGKRNALVTDIQPWQNTVTVGFDHGGHVFETPIRMDYLDIVGDAGGLFKLKNPAKQKAFADSLNENRRYRAGQMVIILTKVKTIGIIIEEIDQSVISVLMIDPTVGNRVAIIQTVPSMLEFISYENPATPPPRRKAKPEAA